MDLSRRDALRGLLAGVTSVGVQWPSRVGANTPLSLFGGSSLTLDNGPRVHIVPTGSRYVSAALLLRSEAIPGPGGLAHLMEHTSFVGAAGPFAAQQIKDMRQDCFQESNASTRPGMILWQVSFLPQHLERAIASLAITSLDQKFDVETVASEARVVLQELYLDKYHSRFGQRRMLGAVLYGRDHPYGADTTASEIARAKMPPERLAAELRDYARSIRLPANMDLFLVGGLNPGVARALVSGCFGRVPFAQGPMLAMPSAPVTRAHRAFLTKSTELRRPLSEIKIAWSTGVSIGHADAKVVLALSEYLNAIIFDQLRERHGDAYSPEATYEPDACSGVFEISIPSTSAPHRVERRVFDAISELKAAIDARGLARFRDRTELRRRKHAESAETLVECLVQRVVDGLSIHDLDLETVSSEDVLAAARKYLPSYKGGYVRLALLGT